MILRSNGSRQGQACELPEKRKGLCQRALRPALRNGLERLAAATRIPCRARRRSFFCELNHTTVVKRRDKRTRLTPNRGNMISAAKWGFCTNPIPAARREHRGRRPSGSALRIYFTENWIVPAGMSLPLGLG